MANQYHGTAVNFSLNGLSIGGITGSFQELSHDYQTQTEIIADGSGNPISKNYFGQHETAELTYVHQGTGTASGTAAMSVLTIGALATVADSADSTIAGSTWLVDDVKVKRGNTTSARVSITLTKYPGIST